ncbi:MAG: hypothetical protein HC913_18815 [Microscillaceae bacterium]|nr:hypothetical protein [Microscillaceae bacterium]
MAKTETKSPNSIDPRIFYIVVSVFVVLFLASLLFMWKLSNDKQEWRKLADQQNRRIDRMSEDSIRFVKELTDLNDRATALNKEVEDLLLEKERLTSQRDSVARLLAYSRTNERNAQAKVVQLQKQLKDLQAKLDDVQRKYDDLLASSGVSGAQYEDRIKLLTQERNNLAAENQRLQMELQKATGNADNRTAIFATSVKAIPGELKRDKFSASTRSQNTDRVEVSFRLSRPPKPTENLIFKVYDPTNGEVAIKPRYRNELSAPADPTNQKVVLEFEAGNLSRSMKGLYSVRLYLTDVNKGLEEQEIGLSTFELK